MDHLILARRPDWVIVNKKEKKKKEKKKGTSRIVDFAVPVDHRVKIKESEKRDMYLDLTKELKTMEHEDDGDTSCGWCTRNNPQKNW